MCVCDESDESLRPSPANIKSVFAVSLPSCVSVQLPIVLSSLVSLYFLELTDVLSPAMVGYRCNDRDLSMPYVETGDELIPLLMLLSLAFAGPAASVSPPLVHQTQPNTRVVYTHKRARDKFKVNVGESSPGRLLVFVSK